MEALKQSIQLDPGNPRPFERRAMLYSMLGRKDEAISDYGRAIQLAPKSGPLYLGRAALYQEVGNSAVAMEDLKQAQALFANDDPRQEQLQKMMEQMAH